MFVVNKLIASNETMQPYISNMGALHKKRSGLSAKSSSLFQIPLPAGYHEKTYGELMLHLAEKQILAIGLLRGIFSNMAIGSKGNKMPYIFTNPPCATELFSNDKVFVLSQNVLDVGAKVVMKVSVPLFIYLIIYEMMYTSCIHVTVTNDEFISLHLPLLFHPFKCNVSCVVCRVS